MDFQSMSKQRKFILIAAGIGIIGMFLPWVDIGFISANGMHGVGILLFLCFLGCGILSLLGDQKSNLNSTYWMLTLIFSALIALIMIIKFLDIPSGAYGIIGYGFYVALLSSVAIALACYMFRAPGQTIKSGFDSLKNDIDSKTKSGTP